MRALARHLERRFNLLALIGGVLGVFLLGWVDYVTGEEISFSIFYLIPVSLVAWRVGTWWGVLISVLSGTAWYMADVMGRLPYSHPAIPVWNAAMWTMIFIIVSCLLSRLKNTLRPEGEVRLEAAKAAGGVSPVALPCRAPAIAPAARPLRVLLVEDDRVNQVIVCQFLKDTNCQVETAENGRVALAKFEKDAYDLVLMDMRMPEMDGLTATRLMRAWEREHGRLATPIVAVTASALAEDRAQCLAAGCANFVAKPLRKVELLAVIQQAANTPVQAAMGAGKPGRPPRVRVDAEVLPLIPAFMAEMGQLLEAIRTAFAANDYGTVVNIAHQITGVGGSYGFEELSVLARCLEGAAQGRDRAQVHGLVLACADYLEKVEVAHD